MAGTRRAALYQTLARKKGGKKGLGMLAIVFGRGTNLDIVTRDTFPTRSISANEEPGFSLLDQSDESL